MKPPSGVSRNACIARSTFSSLFRPLTWRRCRGGRRCRRSCRWRRSRARRPPRAAGYCRAAAAWRNPCGWRCARNRPRVRPTKGRAITRPISRDRTGGARCCRGRRAVRGRTPLHGRRSAAPNRRRCSRSASASSGAPRLVGDDFGARGVAIGENPGQAGLRDHRRAQRSRQSGNGLGEIAPGEIDRRAGDLPMA